MKIMTAAARAEGRTDVLIDIDVIDALIALLAASVPSHH
jgi:hypothetical protein